MHSTRADYHMCDFTLVHRFQHCAGFIAAMLFWCAFLPVVCTILFPSYWLLSHMPIVETGQLWDRNESRLNDYHQSSEKWLPRSDQTSDHLFLSLLLYWLSSIISLLKSLVNSLLHRYSFWRISKRQLLKTFWGNEKLLVTSNFSFFHSVFYSIR